MSEHLINLLIGCAIAYSALLGIGFVYLSIQARREKLKRKGFRSVVICCDCTPSYLNEVIEHNEDDGWQLKQIVLLGSDLRGMPKALLLFHGPRE